MDQMDQTEKAGRVLSRPKDSWLYINLGRGTEESVSVPVRDRIPAEAEILLSMLERVESAANALGLTICLGPEGFY